jgi:glycosyltransferase involved in cell wall biosynthesis
MPENNKIAFLITSTGWGGLEMNTLKLAKLLSERGFEITLYTQEKSTIYSIGEETFHSIELISKRRKYFDFKSASNLGNSLLSRDISRLLVVDNKDLDLAAWCKKRYFKTLKIVYQQHMQIGINKKDWLHTFRFKAIDVWVSPLPFLKREIALRTKFPLNRVQVLPIGLDTASFVKTKYSKSEAKDLLGIQTQEPIVGIIGRISRKKGQFFLVQALQKMRLQNKFFHVLIFGSATVNDEGDKAYAEELKNFVKINQLDDYVHFAESQVDTAKFYNAIDVFVLASHSETYGMVTIEAMLNELPILATDSGGTTEIINHGDFGTLFEYDNQDEFVAKLSHILLFNEKDKMKSQKGKEFAIEEYDQNDEADGFVKIFNAL